MKTLLLSLGILGMVVSVHAADNAAVLLHPEQLKGLSEIKGKVQNVDESTQRLSVTDSSNQQVTVSVSSNTRVTDPGNRAMSWTSLKKGDPVLVYYEPKGRIALQIDRQSTVAEGFLGIDHPSSQK